MMLRKPRIKENIKNLNFEYQFSRAGFVLLLGIVIAAVLGLFSNGLFSEQHLQNKTHTLRLDYDRFGRLTSENEIKVSIKELNAPDYILSFGKTFLDEFQIGSIKPQPDRMYSEQGYVYLVYNHADKQPTFSVWLALTPRKPGAFSNTLQVNNEPEIHFSQFIYP